MINSFSRRVRAIARSSSRNLRLSHSRHRASRGVAISALIRLRAFNASADCSSPRDISHNAPFRALRTVPEARHGLQRRISSSRRFDGGEYHKEILRETLVSSPTTTQAGGTDLASLRPSGQAQEREAGLGQQFLLFHFPASPPSWESCLGCFDPVKRHLEYWIDRGKRGNDFSD